MKKFKRVILILMSMLLITNTSVYADEIIEEVNSNIKIEDIYINNGILMNGVLNYYDLNFQIDKSMDIQSSFLNLDFNVTPIGEYPYSSMVVYLNGSPIGTYNLYELRGTNSTIKIEINKDLLVDGNNVVRIGTFNRITKEQCSLDEVNIANWVNLNDTTYLHLEYIESEEGYDISELPYPFIRRDNKQKFSVVIDDLLEKEASKAAVNFVASMSKLKGNNIGSYEIINLKDLESNIENDIVFIMNYKYLPNDLKELITKEETEKLNNNALVKLISSPYKNGRGVMLITSLNNDYLGDAISVLGEKEYLKKISSDSIIVNNYEKSKVYNFKDRVTFADLGYGTTVVQGTKNSGIKYYYKYPIDKEAIGGEIRLYLKHSPNIDFNNSKVAVKVNGKFLDEQLLKEKGEGVEYISIPITEDSLIDKKAIDIEVIVNMNSFSECISKEDENIWLQIDNSSYIDLQYDNRRNITLDTYAASFIKNKAIEDLDIIIPKGIPYINLAAKIAEYIGIETLPGEMINIEYDNEIISTENNAILIGTPNNNPLIKSINNNSNIKFNDSYTEYVNNAELAILEGNSNDISTLEIIKSPWNKKKNLVVFKSLSIENLDRDIRYLSDTSYIYTVKGTEAAMGNDNITTLSNSKELISKNNSLSNLRRLLVGDKKYILIIFGVTVISILAILFIVYRSNKSEE